MRHRKPRAGEPVAKLLRVIVEDDGTITLQHPYDRDWAFEFPKDLRKEVADTLRGWLKVMPDWT